jgi:phage baseplate assembly protein W
MAEKFINIEFPFQDDNKGKFLSMNNISELAIKSDLMHLLLTNKDERLYLPDFGANLRQYLFEQNDGEVQSNIRQEIQTAVSKYIPNLNLDEIKVIGGTEGETRNEHHALVEIKYTVTDGALKRSDSVQIEL